MGVQLARAALTAHASLAPPAVGRRQADSVFTSTSTPSAPRRTLVLLGMLALAGLSLPANNILCDRLLVLLSSFELLSRCHANALWAGLFLAESLLLCALAPREYGLCLGAGSQWRRYAMHIIVFWIVPQILVVTVYGTMTSRPFHGYPLSLWLFGSIAQELVFSGFIYTRMVDALGAPAAGWRGAFALPLTATAALFALWHWPNMFSFDGSYMAFQFTYTFIGGLWGLQLRRWTGSVLPGIANHVCVNFLASIV